ncbi:uncharacterized protein LOC128985216 [Macrosteles quadrilineatus]|uniref:uncharacterized protein LOC128985216 n=1 Tax=Macrosteles quadrilineatus TaxID=74068 RepID=UPI0023E234D7|nr:uncharacterized protein LOC128985216 [Macrosteles quadrilineatus]
MVIPKFFRINSSPEVLTMWLDESELGPGDVDMILHNVTREEWRALPPRGLHRPRHPFKLVLDHYTYTEPCYSYQQCMREVQQMQRQHMDEGFSDIKYHFLIGGDGNVYEGRGWGKCSSRALRTFVKLWRRRLDIAFIGDYTEKKIPDIMQTRYEHIITYGVHFNMIRIFCNRLHVGKNIMDYVPLECEVRRTTRKKPPRSERPRKKKKKKPKESSDLSFHSNTDLNTDTADSPDTSDREELPFTSTYESSDSTETSDSTKTSESTGKSDSKRESDSSSASDDIGVTKSEIYSSETTAPEESGDNDNEYEEKYDPQKELRKIADKVDKESKIRGEPIELFSFS